MTKVNFRGIAEDDWHRFPGKRAVLEPNVPGKNCLGSAVVPKHRIERCTGKPTGKGGERKKAGHLDGCPARIRKITHSGWGTVAPELVGEAPETE